MKTLLALALLFTALTLKANAQTTTNIQVTFTVELVNSGVTNSSSNILRLDYGNKKYSLRVDGLNFGYGSYLTAIGTNNPVNIKQWQKQTFLTIVDNYAQQKQQADTLSLLQKLTSLLTVNPDLLTAGDLTDLQTIAAKAP